jgi:hypothetical protein
MYIAIFLIISMSTCMYKIAALEKRRGWLWAGMTTVAIVLLYQMMSSTYAPPIIGFVLMFALMTLANIYKPVNKGPF